MIVAPRKFDVLKTNIRACMLDVILKNIKFPRGNVEMYTLDCEYVDT